MAHDDRKTNAIIPACLLAAAVLGHVGFSFLNRQQLVGHVAVSTLLSNSFLIVIAAAFGRLVGFDAAVFAGNRRLGLGLAVSASLLVLTIAMAALWPNRSTHRLGAADLLIIALVPWAEELLFRGMLLDRLSVRLKSRRVAALITAMLFSAAHLPQGMIIALTMFILGGLLAALTFATRSLLWPVALHTGWNGLAILRELAPGSDRFIALAVVAVLLSATALLGTRRTHLPEALPK